MAKTRIGTPNTRSKRKKSCQTEAVGSSLDKTLTNHVNRDWFVSKLGRDQLWPTTFAGDLAGWRPHGVPTRSPVTTLLLWVHTVKDDLQLLFLAIGRGLTLPTSTVRLKMFSSIQSTIDSLVYRWWQHDFWTEHFLGLGPTDYRLKSLEEKPSVPAGGASVPAGGVNCSLYAVMELSSSFSVLGNLLRLVRNESSCSPWSFSAPSSEDLAWISNQGDPTRFFMIFHADHTCNLESRCTPLLRTSRYLTLKLISGHPVSLLLSHS